MIHVKRREGSVRRLLADAVPIMLGAMLVLLTGALILFLWIGKVSNALSRNEYSIEDHAPYQLSRSHCEIDFENGRFVLRDRGSKLGTFVNGEQVCVDSGKISAELKLGENDIVFGTPGSPHHYSIFIEELK